MENNKRDESNIVENVLKEIEFNEQEKEVFINIIRTIKLSKLDESIDISKQITEKIERMFSNDF